MLHAPSIGSGGSEMDRRWLPPDSSSGAGKQDTGSSLGTSEANHVISLPVDLDSLECILAKRASVKVHHYGIEVAKVGYHSTELAELRMRLADGEKVNVRYRDEAGHVWVHDRFRNLFFKVPAKDERMAGKSREVWKAAEKALREKYNEQPSFEATHRCYQEIMEDADEARRSQTLRKRAQLP